MHFFYIFYTLLLGNPADGYHLAELSDLFQMYLISLLNIHPFYVLLVPTEKQLNSSEFDNVLYISVPSGNKLLLQ